MVSIEIALMTLQAASQRDWAILIARLMERIPQRLENIKASAIGSFSLICHAALILPWGAFLAICLSWNEPLILRVHVIQ